MSLLLSELQAQRRVELVRLRRRRRLLNLPSKRPDRPTTERPQPHLRHVDQEPPRTVVRPGRVEIRPLLLDDDRNVATVCRVDPPVDLDPELLGSTVTRSPDPPVHLGEDRCDRGSAEEHGIFGVAERTLKERVHLRWRQSTTRRRDVRRDELDRTTAGAAHTRAVVVASPPEQGGLDRLLVLDALADDLLLLLPATVQLVADLDERREHRVADLLHVVVPSDALRVPVDTGRGALRVGVADNEDLCR